MSKKVLVLGHVDHTCVSQRVIEAITAIGKEPVLVGIEELPEEKGIEIPKITQFQIENDMLSELGYIETTKIQKDGQTNRRERRKQKRK